MISALVYGRLGHVERKAAPLLDDIGHGDGLLQLPAIRNHLIYDAQALRLNSGKKFSRKEKFLGFCRADKPRQTLSPADAGERTQFQFGKP